jgi:nitroreductase
MEIGDAIFNRRAVRDYTDRAVEPARIEQLLAAAVQAPSAMNQQPWAFGVFLGKERLRGYSDRAKAHLLATLHPMFDVHPRSQLYAEPDFNIFYNAGTLLVIYATHGRLQPEEDCCLAAQNLMLAAVGFGLGTCPIGFARPWLNLPENKTELDIPPDCTAIFPVIVGYPAGKTNPVPRRDPVILSWKDAHEHGRR